MAIYDKLLEAKDICHLLDFNAFVTANFSISVRRHIVPKEAIELFQYLIKDEEQIKGLLPRQLQHSFSTKLIGKEPLLLALLAFQTGQTSNWGNFFDFFGLIKRPPEFRFYAPHCKWNESDLKQFHGILFQENIATFCFQDLERTLVIENIESLLPLVGKCDKTLLIWGEGWKCSQLIPLSPQLPTWST